MFSCYILISMSFLHWATSQFSVNGRIVSLQVTDIKKSPSAVIVLMRNSGYYCSGTLLSPTFVLTAAHCLFELSGIYTEDDHSVSIIAGTDKLQYSEEDVKSGIVQIRESEKINIHLKYSWLENFIDDLALIKVSEPFNLTESVSFATIHVTKSDSMVDNISCGEKLDIEQTFVEDKHTDTDPMLSCAAYGFGKVMDYSESEEDQYLKLQSFRVSKKCTCLKKLHSAASEEKLQQKMSAFFCDSMEDSSGLCSGDNGAQLMCEGNLVAIATAVFNVQDPNSCHLKTPKDSRLECGDMSSFSIFTDISQFRYRGWIDGIINVANKSCNATLMC